MIQKSIILQTRLLLGVAVITLFLQTSSPLSAQEERSDQLSRIGAMEAEIRELRGQVEETQHQLSTLNKQMETLNADIDYRLNNPEGDAMPLPLPPTVPPIEGDTGSKPNQEYENARAFLEQGDYEAAERAFAAFVASHPKDKQAGAAQYWLGVTFFVRGDHEKAVTAFAKGYKNYPKSEKGADNLLKLAKSLAALDRKADACTTLDQLTSDYPQFSSKDMDSERKKLDCK
jgi:tol-pal system protein YbgF